MKVSIIGLGLIGGSYAMALKKRLEDLTVYGWDQNEAHLNEAEKRGIIDEKCQSLAEVTKQGNWVILAIPVDAIEKLLPSILDEINERQVLIDFGSTKSVICQVVAAHPKRSQFIAAHPIAGTEYSGPHAAFSDLYENKVMIVCDHEKSDAQIVDRFRKQCKMIGMSTSYLSSDEHDVHLAYVSHLSHVISFGLSRTVLEKEESERSILDLAGSGFASTVRLAKSSPEMWTPIFLKNKKAMLEALDQYISQMQQFKSLLETSDEKGLDKYLAEGRSIRKILD